MVNSGNETELDELHENFVCLSRTALCFKEDVAKLFFCKAVVCFQFLLFLHHNAIGGKFFLLGVLTLLTGSVGSLSTRALCRTPDTISEPTAHFVFSLNLFHPDSFLLEKVLFLCPEVSSKDRDLSDNSSAELQNILVIYHGNIFLQV